MKRRNPKHGHRNKGGNRTCTRVKSLICMVPAEEKSSVARVHLFPGGTGTITVNGRDIDDYFGLETLKLIVRQPLNTTGTLGKVDIAATVTGGGVTGQAGAIRHGISRALLLVDESYRPALKAAGFLNA